MRRQMRFGLQPVFHVAAIDAAFGFPKMIRVAGNFFFGRGLEFFLFLHKIFRGLGIIFHQIFEHNQAVDLFQKVETSKA